MLYFDIGKRRLAAGTPVGNAEPLINQTFFIKGYKYFTDSTGANIIHRKTFTAPITGRPQASDLLPDGIPVFSFHSHTRSKNFSRPRSYFVRPSSAICFPP